MSPLLRMMLKYTLLRMKKSKHEWEKRYHAYNFMESHGAQLLEYIEQMEVEKNGKSSCTSSGKAQ